MTDHPSLSEVLTEHRPYGLDCRCSRPINSDKDWAWHAHQAWREACTIRTAEQLDALPDGSVLRDRDTAILTKDGVDEDPWLEPGGSTLNPILPALLIFHPDWTKP